MVPAKPDLDSKFGTYSLAPWRNAFRRAAGYWRDRFYLFSSLSRKAAVFGLDEPFDVEPVSGFKVRLFPSNNYTDKQCFMGHEIHGTRQIAAIDRAAESAPDGVFHFVDLGANSGLFTLAGAKAAKAAGREPSLIAIEANPDMAERLRFNLQASGFGSAHIFAAAVSDRKGSVFLSRARQKNLGQAMVVGGPVDGTTIEVQALPLLDMLALAAVPRIDFMKVDIEGHEIAALTPFLQNAPVHLLPGIILIEVAHDQDNGISRLLLSHGYRLAQSLGPDAVFELEEGAEGQG